MTVAKTLSNKFIFELGRGGIDFENDAFRLILMNDTYAFDRASHDSYGDISSQELSTGNGYTQGGVELVTKEAWGQDNNENKSFISWENVTITADGNSVGPTKSSVLMRYDSVTPANSLIVGCIDYGDPVTIPDDLSMQLQDLGFDLVQGE